VTNFTVDVGSMDSSATTIHRTQGTAVVGPDMRLASITVEHLEDPTAIGPATVRAVNRALLLARGGVEDDLDAQAEQRIAELDAELDKIHSTLDGIDRQLDDIDRSL